MRDCLVCQPTNTCHAKTGYKQRTRAVACMLMLPALFPHSQNEDSDKYAIDEAVTEISQLEHKWVNQFRR